MKKGQTLVVLEAMKARPSHPYSQSSSVSSVSVRSAFSSHLPQRGPRFTLCQSLLICESRACKARPQTTNAPLGTRTRACSVSRVAREYATSLATTGGLTREYKCRWSILWLRRPTAR